MRHNDLPTLPHVIDPTTGQPLRAIGLTKNGSPIWPVMGGSQPNGEPAPGTAPSATPAAPVPAPVPTPAPTPTPAQATAGQPPVQQPATGTQEPPAAPAPAREYAKGANGEDLGYPVSTPVAEMSPKEEAAYWRHRARTHEDRNKSMSDYDAVKQKAQQYDQLVAASQTEQEKAVSEAEQRGRTAGLLAAGEHVVEALIKAHASSKLSEQSVNTLLENLNRSRFINQQTGAVDADKVRELVDSLVPPAQPGSAAVPANAVPAQVPAAGAPVAVVQNPPRVPDMGQGHPSQAKPSGLAAGRELARQRFKANASQQSSGPAAR